jgi:Zn-finger nucleic acid-binding protein
MTDALACPVCPERPVLRPLDLQGSLRVPLRRCDGCHGVWTDAETAAIASDHFHESHYAMRPGHGRQGCRGCSTFFAEPRRECPRCHANQDLRCPSCTENMRLVEIAGVTLDVCLSCRGVWFDRGELGLVVRNHGKRLRSRIDAERGVGATQPNLGLTPLDVAPDVLGNADLAAAAGEAGLELTSRAVGAGGMEVVAVAGELAVSAGEAVAEGASVAVEAVVDVVAGIFSGL